MYWMLFAFISIPVGLMLYAKLDEKKELRKTEVRLEEFENLRERMKQDHFDYENALDFSIEIYLKFKFKVAMVGDCLMIVGSKENPDNAYFAYGFEKIPYLKIHKDDIRYYTRDGEVITKTVGSGGGSSYSIINGWNGKIKPVKVDTFVIDTKHTELYYSEDNKEKVLTFAYEDYHKLTKLLPDKDFEIVQEKIKSVNNNSVLQNSSSNRSNNNDVATQLKVLNDLIDQKLITEEEYDNKRKQIIDSI